MSPTETDFKNEEIPEAAATETENSLNVSTSTHTEINLTETEDLGSGLLQIDDGDFSSFLGEIEGERDNIEFAINSDLDDLDKSPDVAQEERTEQATVKTVKAGEKMKVPITGKMAASSAKMYVATFDLGLAKICSIMADEKDDTRFRLATKDKEAYTNVSKEFFKAIDFKLSPQFLFFSFSLFISIGSIFSAFKIRKEKTIKRDRAERIRRREIERIRSKEGSKQMSFFPEDKAEVAEEIDPELEAERLELLESASRKKFDYDKKGYYIYTVGGTRIDAGERTEKVNEQVKEWKERDGLRNLQIYKKILEMNKTAKNAK